MNQYVQEQEQKCLEAKRTIDILRIQLLEIENFHYYKTWNYKLKNLKKQINDIYWDL